MNKKQLTVMWIGIAIIALLGLWLVDESGWGIDINRTANAILVFLVVVTIVGSITAGLVATFADKKRNN